MQALSHDFDDSRFHYHQLAREGMAALYSQEHKASGTLRYEVVRLRIAPAYTWPDGHTTPEREAYPGSTSWGRDGWTFFERPAAFGHFLRVVATEEQRQVLAAQSHRQENSL